jgi:hypothetical protein
VREEEEAVAGEEEGARAGDQASVGEGLGTGGREGGGGSTGERGGRGGIRWSRDLHPFRSFLSLYSEQTCMMTCGQACSRRSKGGEGNLTTVLEGGREGGREGGEEDDRNPLLAGVVRGPSLSSAPSVTPPAPAGVRGRGREREEGSAWRSARRHEVPPSPSVPSSSSPKVCRFNFK